MANTRKEINDMVYEELVKGRILGDYFYKVTPDDIPHLIIAFAACALLALLRAKMDKEPSFEFIKAVVLFYDEHYGKEM